MKKKEKKNNIKLVMPIYKPGSFLKIAAKSLLSISNIFFYNKVDN